MQPRRKFLKIMIIAGLGVVLSSFRKFASVIKKNEKYNIILGRPTQNSICLNMYFQENMQAYIEFGNESNKLSKKTSPRDFIKSIPKEITLNNLDANKKYYYRICYKKNDESGFTKSNILSFHTQRKKGSEFVFTITADSHLGTIKHCDPELYQQTLNNVAKDNADLHFSLGDDFRASKVNNPTYEKIEQLYYNQREHLTTLCHSVPYFFILGNHELEAKAFDDGTENSIAQWSKNARTKFVPNPQPNSFYTGNLLTDTANLNRQNYYAFEWGDVLFVTLDVFWYSNISAEDEEQREKQKGEGLSKEEKMKLREANKNNKGNKGNNEHKKDQWAFTIGDAQYQWLQETLEKSKAKFKFVFGHHVMGSSRGAIEWADKFEWGGKDRRGMNQFKQYRPNWKMPIHELFVKNKVTAFLQGHDHIFVRQELDDIAYITCPMCGDPGYNAYNSDAYLTGDKLSNTGHLKMIVTNNDVEMHYIKSVLPKDEAAQGKNGNIVYAWSFINKKTISHA